MTKTRRRFTAEFKEVALNLWEASGRRTTEACKQLGIYPVLFNKWYRDLTDPVRAPKAQAQGMSPAEKDNELAQLRRENARLKMEHEILKKTLGILSEIQK